MNERSSVGLAVIRCGDGSLHPRWSGEGRRFDLGVSYFGDDTSHEFPEADYLQRSKGGKWEGIFEFFRRFPETIEKYRYFWFPDEDILADVASINILFQMACDNDLQLCQPSLDIDSFYSYPLTLQHPSFDLRYTNFVEIMMPLMTRGVLKETLPLFEHARAGFGLDFVFPIVACRISGNGKRCTAIIDRISVCHTRPVGGPLHKMIAETGGPTPLDELRAIADSLDVPRRSSGYGIAVPRVQVIAGRDQHGRLRRGVAIVPTIIVDLLVRARNRATGINSVVVVKHALKTLL